MKPGECRKRYQIWLEQSVMTSPSICIHIDCIIKCAVKYMMAYVRAPISSVSTYYGLILPPEENWIPIAHTCTCIY